jgi:hypothetical protein
VLEGLRDINWAGLTHAYGPATDVPDLLRALAAPPDAVEEEDTAGGEDPLSLLCNLVNHQTSIYPATPFVVPFLVELLAAGPPERRASLLYTLTTFAGYAGPAPPDPFGRAPVAAWTPDWDAAGCVCRPAARDTEAARWRAARQEEEQIRQAMRAAVRAGLPRYLALLGDADPEVRQAAAETAGAFPDAPRDVALALAAALRREGNERVAGAMCATLGRIVARAPGGAGDIGSEPVNLLTEVALRPALGAMARLQPAAALAPLLGAALPDACVRALEDGLHGPAAYVAREALLYIGPERGLPPLLRALAAECAAGKARWGLNQTMEAILDLAYHGHKLRGRHGSTGVGTIRYAPSTNLHRCEDGATRRVPMRAAGEVEPMPAPPTPPAPHQAQALRAITACDHFWAKPSNLLALYGLPTTREGLAALLA